METLEILGALCRLVLYCLAVWLVALLTISVLNGITQSILRKMRVKRLEDAARDSHAKVLTKEDMDLQREEVLQYSFDALPHEVQIARGIQDKQSDG